MRNSRILRGLALVPLAMAALSLSSCGTGPSYAEMREQMPPIPPQHGRVLVYRPSILAAEFQPSVKIDGNPAGVSQAMGYFYSDQYVGNRQLSMLSGWRDQITVNVEDGRNTYVRCDILPGLGAPRIRPMVVDETTGESGMQNCRLAK